MASNEGYRVQVRLGSSRGLGPGFMVQRIGVKVKGSMFQGLVVQVQGSGFRVQGSEIRVQGEGYKV